MSFEQLFDVATRNYYTNKVEDAWAAFGAAQGEQKSFKKNIIDPWVKIGTGGGNEENQAEAFLSKIGLGF